MKKILVISGVPSHPQNQGNRRRIFNMLSSLKKMGFHITFLYYQQPLIDAVPDKKYFDEMKSCWDNFHTLALPKSDFNYLNHVKEQILGYSGNLLKAISPRFHRWIKSMLVKERKYISLDAVYSENLNTFIKKLSKEKFDIVLSEFIFTAKALDLFPDSLKVIDTHDVFTDKHKLYPKYGWISSTLDEERKEINRADVIIAIQEKEKEFFSNLSGKKVITVGHLVDGIRNIGSLEKKRILFVGSENDANQQGINFFIREAWPLVREKFPDAKLLIAGRICNYVKSNSDDIIKLGLLKDLDIAYDLADAVISPIYIGTGLKIKNIEALSYCKPLITTSCCAKELDAKNAYLIADTPEEFSDAVARIFSNKKFSEKLSNNAASFIRKYNSENLRKLKQAFN